MTEKIKKLKISWNIPPAKEVEKYPAIQNFPTAMNTIVLKINEIIDVINEEEK